MHRAMISISRCGMVVLFISFFFLPNKRLLSYVFRWIQDNGDFSSSAAFFEVFSGVAFAEVFSVEQDRDTHFQYAVINTAIIEIGCFLHSRQRDIGGDNHGLTRKQPTIDYIENALLAVACISLRAQIVKNEKIGTQSPSRGLVRWWTRKCGVVSIFGAFGAVARTFDNDSAETLLARMDALAAERVIGDTVAVIQKKRPFLFSLFTHA